MGYTFCTGTLWLLDYFVFSLFDAGFYFGMLIWRMEKWRWDKYQSGNEQMASVLSLEAKHGLFGCQANLKMLSTVAKVHETDSKLFPRVLGNLNCSNPNMPEGLGIRWDMYSVLPLRRNIFLVIYICKLTYWRWSCIGYVPLQKAKKQNLWWSLSGKQLPCWWVWKIESRFLETGKLSKTV